MLVDMTAMRLVLAACVGDRFNNVRAGTIIIPPPTPSMEPKVPALIPTAIRNASKTILSNNGVVFLCMPNKTCRVKIVWEASLLIICNKKSFWFSLGQAGIC
jgi:hypothetical protein